MTRKVQKEFHTDWARAMEAFAWAAANVANAVRSTGTVSTPDYLLLTGRSGRDPQLHLVEVDGGEGVAGSAANRPRSLGSRLLKFCMFGRAAVIRPVTAPTVFSSAWMRPPGSSRARICLLYTSPSPRDRS